MANSQLWVLLAIGVPTLLVGIFAHMMLVRDWLIDRRKLHASSQQKMFID
jgi:hypothetical protein